MSATRASLQQLGKWGAGRLRIGASTTACQYILPAVLREFKKVFRNTQSSSNRMTRWTRLLRCVKTESIWLSV
ncbi:MAG: hypothetical protein ABIV39_01075 [Verrucomicrobiota bacterium]